MTTTELAVRAAGVGKVFPTKAGDVVALTGVELTVDAGEFVSLIGPSGCGKSTLLRLIADLDTASSGELEIFGKPARQARIDQDYGIAFQQAGLLPWRTVGGNIELPLELHGMARRSERRASRNWPRSSVSPTSSIASPTSCRAECSSASPLHGRSPSSHACC